VLADEGPRGPGLDLPPLDGRLEAEVEVAQRQARRQVGQLQRRAPAPPVAGADLPAQQPVQHGVRRPVVLDGLGQLLGQRRRGMAQAQLLQLLARPAHLQGRAAAGLGRRRRGGRG
jgi:hypothetical protein